VGRAASGDYGNNGWTPTKLERIKMSEIVRIKKSVLEELVLSHETLETMINQGMYIHDFFGEEDIEYEDWLDQTKASMPRLIAKYIVE